MLRIVLVNELRKTQRTSHAGGPAADNDNVGVHPRMLDIWERFAEDQHRSSCSTKRVGD
jgi:hypothetical protein